jgi:hypothetical protein
VPVPVDSARRRREGVGEQVEGHAGEVAHPFLGLEQEEAHRNGSSTVVHAGRRGLIGGRPMEWQREEVGQ